MSSAVAKDLKGQANTHVATCKQLAKQLEEHINELEALRSYAGSEAAMPVLSREGPSKRARLVDKFELLSEAEQRQLLRGS